jgi:hypothetical protein
VGGLFGRFFRQFFLLVTVQQMTGGLFRFIGGMCRSMIKAHSVGFVTILLFFMLGGFIIPRPYIRVWWVWFYWISPLTYANQALSVNELLAPRWSKVRVFLFTLQNVGNIGIDGWIFCVMIILVYLQLHSFLQFLYVLFLKGFLFLLFSHSSYCFALLLSFRWVFLSLPTHLLEVQLVIVLLVFAEISKHHNHVRS